MIQKRELEEVLERYNKGDLKRNERVYKRCYIPSYYLSDINIERVDMIVEKMDKEYIERVKDKGVYREREGIVRAINEGSKVVIVEGQGFNIDNEYYYVIKVAERKGMTKYCYSSSIKNKLSYKVMLEELKEDYPWFGTRDLLDGSDGVHFFNTKGEHCLLDSEGKVHINIDEGEVSNKRKGDWMIVAITREARKIVEAATEITKEKSIEINDCTFYYNPDELELNDTVLEAMERYADREDRQESYAVYWDASGFLIIY